MNGKGNIRFTELFTDTMHKHGYLWSLEYYTCKKGMSYKEFRFWFRATFMHLPTH